MPPSVVSCAPQVSSWLLGTRKVYYDELSRDVRLLTLLCVAFFSPGKQAALCNLSRYLALLTTTISNIPAEVAAPAPEAGANLSPAAAGAEAAAAARGADTPAAAAAGTGAGGQQQDSAARTPQPTAPAPAAAGALDGTDAGLSNLLRYVPLVYVEVVVDFLTVLRKSADSAVGTPAMDLQVCVSCWLQADRQTQRLEAADDQSVARCGVCVCRSWDERPTNLHGGSADVCFWRCSGPRFWCRARTLPALKTPH